MPKEKKLSIFIVHPSDLLTNHQPHGDGLVAFEFISRLAAKGHTLHVMANSIDIKGNLPENIKLYSSNIHKSTNLIGRIVYILKVKKIFNEIRNQYSVDIVHQLNPVVPGLTLALGRLEIPLILGPVVATSARRRSFLSKLFSIRYQLNRIIFFLKNILLLFQQEQASTLLVATPAAYNRILLSQRNKTKVHNLSHGIDVKKFFPAPCEKNKSRIPKILFLGKVTRYKGIFTLLDAFERVNLQVPNCQLWIAGSWHQEIEKVKDKIQSMNSYSQVFLFGKVSRQKALELIQDCTVMCVPSFSEPFGMVALEGMACGKPIVASDSGGLKYLVDERGGYKVEPGNPEQLASALLQIIQSNSLQISMGNFNRKHVENNFSWEKIVEELEQKYYELTKA